MFNVTRKELEICYVKSFERYLDSRKLKEWNF